MAVMGRMFARSEEVLWRHRMGRGRARRREVEELRKVRESGQGIRAMVLGSKAKGGWRSRKLMLSRCFDTSIRTFDAMSWHVEKWRGITER